jgi:cell pole-organizing protein PopZ
MMPTRDSRGSPARSNGTPNARFGSEFMSQAAKLQEPSMEEILASIRRIISDDDAGTSKPADPTAPTAPRDQVPPLAANNSQDDIDAMLAEYNARSRPAPSMVAPPPASPAADVFELTEGMSVPPAPPPAAHFRAIDPDSDLVFSEKPSAPVLANPAAEPAARAFEDERRPFTHERALLSNAAETSVDHAFNALAQTVLGTHMRTLEDLVQEMLRPMLKGWLDDNLPSLVERIVRDEIERVARGRH